MENCHAIHDSFKIPSSFDRPTQSFNFLVSVAEFKTIVDASITESKAVGSDFDKYLAIVREYIESGACSEVRDGQAGADGDRSPHEMMTLALYSYTLTTHSSLFLNFWGKGEHRRPRQT